MNGVDKHVRAVHRPIATVYRLLLAYRSRICGYRSPMAY
nr:MAG TPA_asm: hypothetical protein [Caudoviricetes sp.]